MKKLMFLVAALFMAPALVAQSSLQRRRTLRCEFLNRVPPKPEVKEFFSYYCPACNAIDPVVQSCDENPAGGHDALRKYHVDFMGAASAEIQRALSTAMVLAKTQGKGDEVNKAFL